MLRTSRVKRAKAAMSKRRSESRSRGAAGGQNMDAMRSWNTDTFPCREHGRYLFSKSWTLPFSKHGRWSFWPHGRCVFSSHGRCRMSCILLYNNANTVCGGRRRSRPSMTGECAVIKEAVRYKATTWMSVLWTMWCCCRTDHPTAVVKQLAMVVSREQFEVMEVMERKRRCAPGAD